MLVFVFVALIILLVSTSVMAQGSCQGACGGESDDGCFCDDACEVFGDCCPDKEQVCNAETASCMGACGGRAPAGCWCDEECTANGDCCTDKEQVCQMTAMDVPNIEYCMNVAMWPPGQKTLEEEVLVVVNQRRTQGADCRTAGNFAATAPLTMHLNLRCAARVHSQDMVMRNYFSHNSPEGETPFQRIMRAEYQSRTSGENIAAGRATAQETVDQWMSSDRHCSNIMNPNYRDIGVGYATGPNTDFTHYWTQVFGTPPDQ